MSLDTMTIAMLTADDGVERVELTHPRDVLEDADARVVHISPDGGRVRTFDQTDPSEDVTADAALDDCAPQDFDALVLPGGYINPDKLRGDDRAVAFTRSFAEAGKPIGVICHGPWTLIEADAVRNRTLAAVPSLKTDIANAGGTWVDEDVHVDRAGRGILISGRNHQTVEQFADVLARELDAV